MSDLNTRKDKRTPVTLKIKFKSATLDQFIERYSVDVSHGGIFIRTKDPLTVGTHLRFEFQLQDASPLISGEGTVVWTREHDPSRIGVAPGMGVRFDRLAPESQPVLEKILAQKGKDTVEPRFDGGRRAPSAPGATAARARATGAAAARTGFPDEPSTRDPTPLPKPMPFHAAAGDEDFNADVFDQPTRVTSLDGLLQSMTQDGRAEPAPLRSTGEPAAEAAPAETVPEAETPAEEASAEQASADTEPAEQGADEQAESAEASAEGALAEGDPEEAGSQEAASADAGSEEAGEPLPPPPVDEAPAAAAHAAAADDGRTDIGRTAPARTMAAKLAAAGADDGPLPPPRRRRSSGGLIFGVVTLAAAAGAYYMLVLNKPPAEVSDPYAAEPAVAEPAEATPPPDPTTATAAAVAGEAADTGPPEPTGLSVEVTSTPAGAEITLDGDERGTTPTTLTGLEEGKRYQLVVRSACHRAEELAFEAKAGASVDVKLSPLDRVVHVTSTPPGATIKVDGKAIRAKTPAKIELTGALDPTRPHTIAVTKAGFADAETTVTPDVPCTERDGVAAVDLAITLAKRAAPAKTAPAATKRKPTKPAADAKDGAESDAANEDDAPGAPSKPADAKPATDAKATTRTTKPTDAKPTEPKPADGARPTEPKPADGTKPTESKPADGAKSAPSGAPSKPAPSKPGSTKPKAEDPSADAPCDPSPDAPEWARCK